MNSSRSSSHAAINTPLGSSVASPTQNGNGPQVDNVVRSKILLLGQRRSGKTSIQEFVFHNITQKQTFYLEMTTRITKLAFDTIIPLEIWDCPGTVTLETLGTPLSHFSSIIFVIDIQDLYAGPIAKLMNFFIAAYQENPNINLEVFVHKADAHNEEYKIENFRHIQQRVWDELGDENPDYEQMPISFHLTSIHDHSLHEAFSRVIHKLIDSLPYLEDLLNVFCANSQASKAYLFDINARLYVATDSSPVDHTQPLCNDYLQMLNSLGSLYRSISASPPRHVLTSPSATTSPATSLPASPRPPLSVISSASHTPALGLAPLPEQSRTPSPKLPLSPSAGSVSAASTAKPRLRNLFYPSASSSLSHTSSGVCDTVVYHLITPQLALLAILPTAVFESRRGLIEYNVVFFREGVQEICEVEEEARKIE